MKYRRTGIITSARLDNVKGTGAQRLQRRLRHRAQAQAQAEGPKATRSAQSTCAKIIIKIHYTKTRSMQHKERNITETAGHTTRTE